MSSCTSNRAARGLRVLVRGTSRVAAALLLAVPGVAVAQDDSTKSATIFDADSILALTIAGDIRELTRDRDTTRAAYHPITVDYIASDGRRVSVPAEARTRGIWRRATRNCEFPPLRLRFEKEQRRETLFRGQRAVKLVTHCKPSDRYEQYVMQEYLLYRIYNLLTPNSLRARLARVSYADTRGKTESHIGILLEDDEELAQRLGGEVIEARGGLFKDFDTNAMALAAAFQYMIGNTDWSLSGLHNMAIIIVANQMPIPLPYDFDFAGAVGTHYATPDPRVGIRSVRQRRYRGNCLTEEEWAPIIARFNEQREAIRALYESAPIIDRDLARRALAYFDEFYRTINDRRALQRELIDPCLPGA